MRGFFLGRVRKANSQTQPMLFGCVAFRLCHLPEFDSESDCCANFFFNFHFNKICNENHFKTIFEQIAFGQNHSLDGLVYSSCSDGLYDSAFVVTEYTSDCACDSGCTRGPRYFDYVHDGHYSSFRCLPGTAMRVN